LGLLEDTENVSQETPCIMYINLLCQNLICVFFTKYSPKPIRHHLKAIIPDAKEKNNERPISTEKLQSPGESPPDPT
jgi:hypothetical protein